MKTMKFAVVLAGCGVYDGAEIHEATLALLAIDQLGSTYQCFAPNMNQHHVINHITGEEMKENRNVLIESARIARGGIKDLKEFNANDFDAIVFPGGFGVAKNLASLAFDGANMNVNNEVEGAVKAMAESGKPIGALCIAPAVMVKILEGATVTIGQDPDTINVINELGGSHSITSHGDVIVDKKYNLFTTPCYMLDATISQIAEGAKNVIQKIIEY